MILRLFFYQVRVQLEDGNNSIEKILIEILGFDRSNRAEGRLIGWLGGHDLGFGQIEAGQGGIEIEV